jgi:hypothetical protein
LGLEVHEYVFAPAGLASVQIRLRELSALNESREMDIPRLQNKKAVGIFGLPTALIFSLFGSYPWPNGQTMTKKE